MKKLMTMMLAVGAMLGAEADDRNRVQLWENGPYWAETNIGAENPEDPGYYFWWGDTVGYKRVGDAWVATDGSSSNFSFSSENTPTYSKNLTTLESEGWIVSQDGTYVLAPEHDAAQVQWGGGWHMPTERELSDLSSKCDWTWTDRDGVKGAVIKGKGAYASASIFFPFTGLGYEGGDCWSSVPSYDRSYHLGFGLTRHRRFVHGAGNGHLRYRSFPVRPVQSVAK